MGFFDRVVPPAGIWITLNHIHAPKEAVPMIEANHVHLTPDKVGAFDQRSIEVLRVLSRGGGFELHSIAFSLKPLRPAGRTSCSLLAP